MSADLDLPSEVDVLVAGAGPAGLAAAYTLSQGGAPVLVVDTRQRIGHPARCGEITRASLFQDLGIDPRPEWVRWKLTGGWSVLDRPRMEQELAQLLADKGVLVRPATTVVGVGRYDGGKRRVTLASGGRQVDVAARLVIAADGVSSRVAAMAGLRTRLTSREIVSCLGWRVVEATLADPRALFFDYRPELKPFYFWVIPTSRNEANVGLGLLGTRGHAARPLLERIAGKSRAVRGGRVVETIAGCFPSAYPLDRPFADGLLVAGTAARLVTADTGEGIWPAAISGKAAAEVYLASGGRTGVEQLKSYRQRLNKLYLDLHWRLVQRWARER
jgi:digeranylgeranylglycerophospholipid reductase